MREHTEQRDGSVCSKQKPRMHHPTKGELLCNANWDHVPDHRPGVPLIACQAPELVEYCVDCRREKDPYCDDGPDLIVFVSVRCGVARKPELSTLHEIAV